MPVYAEIVVRSETEEPPVKVDEHLNDPIRAALRKDAPENLGEPEPRKRLTGAIAQEIARQFGPKAAEILGPGHPAKFIAKVLREVRKFFGGASLRSIDHDAFKRAVRDAIREEAERLKLPLQALTLPTPTLWAYPLGVVATDHVGYLSYDLSRLPATVLEAVAAAVRDRRLDPAAPLDVTISIYPTGLSGVVFDALSQGRFTLEAIVVRMDIAKPLIPPAVLNLALPSMQSPKRMVLKSKKCSTSSINQRSALPKEGRETSTYLSIKKGSMSAIVQHSARVAPKGAKNLRVLTARRAELGY